MVIVMNLLESWFRGLADVTRLRVLNLLAQGELCGCDVQYVLGVNQSNISRHLTYLRNCGLVQYRRSANRIYYRIASAASIDHKLLFDYLSHALRHEEPFGSDLKKLKVAIKNGGCTVSELHAYEPTVNAPRVRTAQK
jgi:ArsR family transcriptional regulator